jgi:transcriptional regulator with XRE-family HTH domain
VSTLLYDGEREVSVKARNNLRLLRDNRGFSLRKLGEVSGIDFGSLSKIERGRSIPTDVQLEKLCAALGVTVDLLYPDDELRRALAE